jgi:nitrate/TMAO reductase-like tetraheme cytochrome c subunit
MIQRRWFLELGLAFGLTVAALAAGVGVACNGQVDIHDTAEGRGPCINCHASAYRTASNPVHVGVMPETCNDCHDTHAWIPVDFGPEKHKWFPLQNKHDGPVCTDCHTKGFRVGDTSKECIACHQKDADAAKDPVHVGFPADCKVCHNDLGWKPSIFQHPWPLLNKHATTPCAQCHTGSPPKWAGMSTDCASCHKLDYDAAANPIHRPIPPTTGMLVGGGRTCADCHTTGGGTPTGGWRPSSFVHPIVPFQLTGAHADPKRVACNDCHQAPKPAGTAPRGYDAKTFLATKCFDCHQDRLTTAMPSHATFDHECRLCHSTDLFKGATTHPEAKFNLLAPSKHVGINCADCHDITRGPSTGGANTNCVACHGYAGGAWAAAHALPPLDQRHTTKGITGCAAGQTPSLSNLCFPTAAQTNANPNVCRACHPLGKR